MWIFGILLIVLAIVLAGVYLSDKRKLAQMEATETSSAEFLKSLATSMADGVGAGSLRYLSEIKGKTVYNKRDIEFIFSMPSSSSFRACRSILCLLFHECRS